MVSDQLCPEDREALEKWEPLYTDTEDYALTDRGWQEFRRIGRPNSAYE